MPFPAPRRPALLALLLIAPPVAAQITPITVPKGQLRLDFQGALETWDRRWRDGTKEEAVALNGILGRDLIPGLRSAEAALRQLTGRTDLTLDLGRGTASKLVSLGTFGIGGAFGLGGRLTIHAMVPIVAVKVEPRLVIDSATATAGFNPHGAIFGAGAGGPTETLLTNLAAAIGSLQSKLAAGDYDADPAQKQLAIQTVAQAQATQAGLVTLLGPDSQFAPRAGSTAAQAVADAITALQATFTTLGVPFTGSAEFAETFTFGDFQRLLTDPAGPTAARAFDDLPTFSYVGDVEVGAAFAVVDRFPRDALGTGIRAVIDATVRLPTAQQPDPDRLLDVGTGDRQLDVEVSATADITRGRLGARLSGGYTLQLAGNVERRIAAIDEALPPASSKARLRWNPGDVLRLSAQPFFRLAPYLSLFGSADLWSRQEDGFEYAPDQPPISGVEPAVLAAATKSSGVNLGFGLSYAHGGLDKRGLRKLPMDASFRYQWIGSTGTGILPDAHVVRIDLRFYTRLFGRAPDGR